MNTEIQPTVALREPFSVLSLGRGLCVLAMLFASGDVWPTVTVGFAFRFSQLCALLATVVLVLGAPQVSIKRFPGAFWLFAFVVWVFAELPASLFPERTAAYAVWTLLDVLMVATFVQYYSTPDTFQRLFRWFVVCFIVLAVFGVVQLALSVVGIELFLTEWWIPGKLARINGISYEPSYYSTYLLPGWILSVYLLEKGAPPGDYRLLRMCAYTTTIALILCTSRTGWLMMILWLMLRVGLFVWRTLFGGRLTRHSARRTTLIGAAAGACAILAVVFSGVLLSHVDDLSFVAAGLGVLGQSSHSADDRSNAVSYTWNAFLAHPIIGTGVGALPVEIASQTGGMVLSLADAKEHEGFSLLLEILASTGIIGASLLALSIADVARCLRVLSKRINPADRNMLRGLAWATAWLVFAMFFNSNFLRLYIFLDLAVLICGIVAFGTVTSARWSRHEPGKSCASSS